MQFQSNIGVGARTLLSLARSAFIALLLASTCETTASCQTNLPTFSAPAKLNFQDLLKLAEPQPPPPALAQRLDHLLSEPFISNEETPAQLVTPSLDADKPMLRVAEWNINHGLNQKEIELSLSKSPLFEQKARQVDPGSSRHRNELRQELKALRSADIVVLDEVDLGVKRTQYLLWSHVRMAWMISSLHSSGSQCAPRRLVTVRSGQAARIGSP